VICSQPRTGSWFLCEALRSTGIAGLPEEYFRQDWAWQFAWNQTLEADHRIDYWPPAAGKGTSWPESDAIDTDGYAEAVRRIAATDNGVMAVKLHMLQFRQFTERFGAGGNPVPMTEATLRRWFPNPRYVLLTRRDHLRQATSYYRAIESNDWWERGGQIRSGERSDAAVSIPREPDLPQIEILRRFLVAEDQQWRQILADAQVPPLELAYEEVTTDPHAAVAAILRHLEVDEIAPDMGAVNLTRQADELTDRTVERYHRWRRAAAPVPWKTATPEPAPRSAAIEDDRDPPAMRQQTIVVENFYADPQAVREYALRQQYYAPYESRQQLSGGEVTPSWLASRFKPAQACPFKSSEQLLDTLEDIIGEDIDRRHWFAHFPTDIHGYPTPEFRSRMHRTCLWNCAFHVNLEGGKVISDDVHNHVTDLWNSVDTTGWWGIIYLSPEAPLVNAVNIWRNKDPERQLVWTSEPHEWELRDTLANIPNRLVLGRGTAPHSEAKGWGTGIEDGRLFQTFFFRTLATEVIESVSIEL
jgi:LPS sulfotransferase NodH